MSTYGTPSFASLDQHPTGAGIGSLAASFGVQSMLVVGIIYMAFTAPQFINTQISHIDLVAPVPELAPKPEVVKVARQQPLPKPIKDTGEHEVTVKLGSEIQATLHITVSHPAPKETPDAAETSSD